MSDLENFNNIHANLSESAYNDRPDSFLKYSGSKNSEIINYSEDVLKTNKQREILSFTKGGTNLPNDGIVYLQLDPTIKTTVTPKTYQTP